MRPAPIVKSAFHLFLLTLLSIAPALDESVNVLVHGATPAGVCAALGVAVKDTKPWTYEPHVAMRVMVAMLGETRQSNATSILRIHAFSPPTLQLRTG